MTILATPPYNDDLSSYRHRNFYISHTDHQLHTHTCTPSSNSSRRTWHFDIFALDRDSPPLPLEASWSLGSFQEPFEVDSGVDDFASTPALMQSEQSSTNWSAQGQLTPTSATKRHHREASLSSLGSAGPASPYTVNFSNPQVAGDAYHDFNHEYTQPSSKPLTPTQTPLQDQFLTSHYAQYFPTSGSFTYTMGQEGLPKQVGAAELMPATDFGLPGRRAAAATREPPITPPYCEDERNKNGYRNPMPKLARTMTDIYADELYNPNFQITSTYPTKTPSNVVISTQNDVFAQRLKAANNQHLHASKIHVPLAIPSRERSPFRQGSPLAPTGTSFEQQAKNVRFGTATHMREQQKAEDDARAIQRQLEMASPEQSAPRTISPKDVDLVYHETEADASLPLFPPDQSHRIPSCRPSPILRHEPSETDDDASQRSFTSMATSRRESFYSASSQTANQQKHFSFAPPTIPGGVGQPPQQFAYGSRSRPQPANSTITHDKLPATLTTADSSKSDYAAEMSSAARPSSASADTGTYTCTYHGCSLRFDTPAKLQRHKREGHRNALSINGGGDERGMTSAALPRNSQAGPHKCERTNPSTGKPCNIVFSRPYDLTRHEDTIHNARKQKVRCHLCTEEKTFSRNDALTRHFRVVHPEHVDFSKGRRRSGHD